MNIVKETTVPTRNLLQTDAPLFDALVRYANSETVSFDVPGHKMGTMKTPFRDAIGEQALKMDVNSMAELDLLSHPKSVIKEAQELAAQSFGADHAFFLVNGTTVGIHAMILATCKPGETLLVPRNCHKSVIDGMILSGVIPAFMQPEVDDHFGISHGVSVENVSQALREHPSAKALLITYPTYFGTMTDLKTICELAHKSDVIVLVDAAHGAHLKVLDEMIDPIVAGADLVTTSMHKTGGSLTQSSLLLLQGNCISADKVRKVTGMLQTTSANYFLMSSLDAARRELVLHGADAYRRLKPIVAEAIEAIESGKHYEVLKSGNINTRFLQSHDWTKLVIRVNGLGRTGFEVYSLLKQRYGIQMELAEGYVVMAIITPADTEISIGRLTAALLDIERTHKKSHVLHSAWTVVDSVNELVMTPRDAYYAEQESIAIDDAIGRISADTLMIYPPGIPLVIPGERITCEVVQHYTYYEQEFGSVLSGSKQTGSVTVVKGGY
ncbi:aminotransferase class I/II-fold pyridoxal phosphate-dependent enzyme [Sporosarcina aquimarina]|uniref:aminotransferase class I/II-fold pyridoxal phosphate-dependent enzyme n=1 Tax=Sporosarcina aquimarina TaxID=114975 RepID=UPI00203FDF3A|nr:aminotransferase class I/II-fold pyridoxal phosphate-dependent enzyme [Sporosarcina aquimarina]MCM3758294.1 aminotransferase class I/II-fold pyridoxal phosphate-dependent enzyme [Sporosarcina aquimarina]